MQQQLDEQARPYIEALVTTLKQSGAISSPSVEAAFRQVPRHRFLEHFYRREQSNGRTQLQEIRLSSCPNVETWLQAIYANHPLATVCDEEQTATSSSSAPEAMAFMLEAADVQPGLRVLEIGAGTGFNAGLLATLVGDPHHVFSVEIEPDVAQLAQARLNEVVGAGVTVHAGDGLAGYAPGAPYDRILATGSTSHVPLAWLEQLRPGGILVMNLIGQMGACAFLKVVKQAPGSTAHGHFLSRSSFMQLHDFGQYPRNQASSLLGQYIARPVLTQPQSITRADFDLTLLWERQLDFVLQLSFPQMIFTSAYANPICPCLIDLATETMLLFRPQGDGQWHVEVRGDPYLWERVLSAYRQWVAVGCPDVTAYHLDIDACGIQTVALTSPLCQTSTSTWVLYSPPHRSVG